LIERVFRELASVVGYVDDFDLAEPAAQVPIGASNARSGRDAGTNMSTHRVSAERELR
jgi:hypothetical protein